MKKLSLTLVLALLVSAFGCLAAMAEPEPITLPITEEPITLTVFHVLNPKVSKTWDNYAKIACYQELMARTGITLEFVHPAMGSETEQFNLMCSSGDFTDLIWYYFTNVTGGLAKAMDDGAMIDLKEPIAQWGPNMTAAFEEYPQVRINVSTDDGRVGYFPTIFTNMLEVGQNGFFLRGDWLEKLGLDYPETLDDWHEVLVAFRDQDPNGNGEKDEIPFAPAGFGQISRFAHAWNLDSWNEGNCFVVHDKTAVYSPYDPNYKEFVKTMAKWYAEGLIDPEYLSKDQAAVDNLLGTSISGASVERNSKTSAIMKVFRNLGMEDATIVGTWYPKAEEGGTSYNPREFFKITNGSGVCITSTNEHVKESVKLLDYGYSEEGSDLLNWGPEGNPIYTVDENGEKHLSEFCTNNPDGLSMDQAISVYSIGAMDGERWFSPVQYHERMMIFPEQTLTNERWDDADMSGYWPAVAFTMDEADEVKEIKTEIDIYVAETINKMIMGQIDVETEYDAYLEQLRAMGVERMIEIYQTALDRYYLR